MSQCFTPSFKAELVGSEGNARVEDDEGDERPGIEALAGEKEILLARDDMEKGTVIQIRIVLGPPNELLEVEENFKGERKASRRRDSLSPSRVHVADTHPLPSSSERSRTFLSVLSSDAIVILANESVIEVPIYALGKMRNRAGFDIIDNLDEVKVWPKPAVLGNLIGAFLGEYQRVIAPDTPYDSINQSLPGSRQTSKSNHTFVSSTLNSTLNGGGSNLNTSLRSLNLNSTKPTSSRGTQRSGHLVPLSLPVKGLTRNEIAFEIDGVFYNTMGAEIGRLAETTSIFHLNEIETFDGEAYQEAEDQDQELDLEESQGIADQQLIASQLMLALEYGEVEGGHLEEALADLVPPPSLATSASTSYAGSRINTPQMVPGSLGLGPGAKSDRHQDLLPPSGRRESVSGASARKEVREMQHVYDDASPRQSRLSHREMQAIWDAIEGL